MNILVHTLLNLNPSLTHLSLISIVGLRGGLFEQLKSGLPLLESLCLADIELSARPLAIFVASCPRLRSVTVSNLKNFMFREFVLEVHRRTHRCGCDLRTKFAGKVKVVTEIGRTNLALRWDLRSD